MTNMLYNRPNGQRSAKIVVFAVLLQMLSGCVGAGTLGFSAKPTDTVVIETETGNLLIGGTSGYCISDRKGKARKTGTLVILGPCAPSPEGRSSSPKGLLIASVLTTKEIEKALEDQDLDAFFRSDLGLQTLSNSQDASTVSILGTMTLSNVFYVHSKDSNGPTVPDASDDQWRGFFVVSKRLVSISLINFLDNKIPDGVVFSQLEEFADQIKRLNP